MIDFGSGAYPTFVDVNGNGLKDMIVGNWGEYDSSNYIGTILKSYYSSSLSLIINNGIQSMPLFQHVDSDLGGLKQFGLLGLFPAAYDIDNDGDIDIIVGQSDGTLIFLENIAGSGNLPQFNAPVFNYASISVGHFSTPQLFDIDKDGLVDLVVGNRAGKIAYYKNVGTASVPSFSLITDFLGGVDVRDYNLSYFGYATPHFFRHNDTTYLLVGTESGKIQYFKNIDGNLNGNFTKVEDEMFFVRNNQRFPISEGIRTSPTIADLNNDNFPDLMIGNFAGGLTYYSGINAPPINIGLEKVQKPSLNIAPNPACNSIKLIGNCNYPIVQIMILDVTGRTVKQFLPNPENLYSISDLSSGVYYFKIIFNNQLNHTIKFLRLCK